jgi:hypothetical protein
MMIVDVRLTLISRRPTASPHLLLRQLRPRRESGIVSRMISGHCLISKIITDLLMLRVWGPFILSQQQQH